MATQSVSSSGSLPSYRSKADPPPSYCSSVSSASRPNQSSVSSISSSSTPMFTRSSEPSSTSSSSSSSSSSSMSSQPTISPNNHRHHSHYHSHRDTHNHYHADGLPRPPHRTNETAPLLPHSRKRHTQSSSPIIILATVAGSAFMALFFLLIRAVSSSRPPPMSAWANVTGSKLCHSTGVREYTATLMNVAKGWDPIDICNRTQITIHGIQIPNPVSCTFKDTPAGLVIQGAWLVDHNERDCYPAWSIIHSGDCASSGARSYYAHLDYVPPGLGSLESCKEAPAIIHGQSLFPDRCELVPESGSHNGSLVARGEWIVDFEENDCIPTWQPLIADQCVSYATRSYHADLVVPLGLEKKALSLCNQVPTSIHGRSVYPTSCEELNGSQGVAMRGRWDVNFSEPECTPEWTDISSDWQCHAYNAKKFTAILSDIPEELDPLHTCRQAPLEFFGIEQKPISCEWDEQDRVVGMWFVGVPECRPVLKNIIDYGCIESEDGYKRIEGEVVDIGKNEDWYRLCTTVPYHSGGKTYLPVQCESRTSWAVTRRYALYNIASPGCRK